MANKAKSVRITGKQAAGAAAVVAGVAAIGAGLFLFKDKTSERPHYTALIEDGDFSIRAYPPLLVAETVVTGIADRKKAQNDAFRTLADYIFAKSRDGEKIAMTAPVLVDRPVAGAAMPHDASDGLRMRFVMPREYAREDLPEPPEGVTISELPARRVAAVAFSGRWTDASLQEEEAELRAWLEEREEGAAGQVEYAFYDAPMIPGPLRLNEVLIPIG
jgi:hypothetical protein